MLLWLLRAGLMHFNLWDTLGGKFLQGFKNFHTAQFAWTAWGHHYALENRGQLKGALTRESLLERSLQREKSCLIFALPRPRNKVGSSLWQVFQCHFLFFFFLSCRCRIPIAVCYTSFWRCCLKARPFPMLIKLPELPKSWIKEVWMLSYERAPGTHNC